MTDRLSAYQRLSGCKTAAAVRDLVTDWEGSWGEPPVEVLNLGWMAEVRVRARALGIERASMLKVRAVLDFHVTTTVAPTQIAELLASHPQRFSLDPHHERRLFVRFTPEEAEHPYHFLHWAFRQIETTSTPA